MGLGHSPRIITDGLVLALDAANPKNYNLTAVEVLVVAGGGSGGGYGGNDGAGGGGAGGLIYNSNFSVTPGSALTVTVGGGGSGASGWGSAGQQGGNSVFGSLTAIGGGAGLHRASATNSGTGGSGGGDAGGSGYTLSNATAGQGFSGGNSPENGTTDEEPGGGGGGAGGPGENASTPTASDNATVRATAAGAGGPGLGFNISGTFTYYAGGGGGSNRLGVGKPGGIGGGGTGGASPTAGTPNTGGGGGGTGFDGYGGGGISAAGGSGIVIVRYPGPQKAIGGTVTSVAGHTIHTFTTVGSTTFTPLVATNNSAILGLADFSGRNNFGTTVNSPTYSSANGGSLVFDGVNDYISIPSQLDAQSPLTGYGSFTGADTNAFTLEIWIKTSQISGSSSVNAPHLIGRDNGDIYSNLSLYDGYVYFVHYNSAWLTNLKSTTMVSNGLWHQVVYVNNTNETGIIYIDGRSEVSGSSSISGTNYFSPDYIGRGYSAKYFQGNIANCKFYDRALTATEISQNFNAIRGRFGI